MQFILAIEPGTSNTSFGVVVPDLPGCFSAGDTLDEAIQNAQEAIALHCSTLIEDGLDLPPVQTIAQHQANQADPEYAGWIGAVVDVPVEKYLGPAEKINITLPSILLGRIDAYARAHGATRSGFLADAARRAMST